MNSPTFIVDDQSEQASQPIGIGLVGDDRQAVDDPTHGDVLPEMTDEEREAAAYRAGVAMQSWYSRYQATGDRTALRIAHHHMTQMVSILAGRSAEYIAKLEKERGLDGR